MIPMNLMKNKKADYIVTGQWAKKAAKEAELYGEVNVVASSADKTFSYIPDCSDLPIDDDADYVYICENNTIYGTKFHTLPNTKGKTCLLYTSPECLGISPKKKPVTCGRLIRFSFSISLSSSPSVNR